MNNQVQEIANEQTEEPKNVEEILEKLGGFGRFQALALVLILAMEIPTGMLCFVPVFIGATPAFWLCDGKSIPKSDACGCNGTLIPIEPSSSINAEWSLICDSSWVSDTAMSVQLFAMFVGNIVICQIADWYGRRYSFSAMAAMMALGQALTAASPNPFVYMGARFICGASFSAFLSINTTYSMEFMTPKWRPLCALGPFGVGIMLLGIMANYIRDWRTLVWATTAPYALIVFIHPFIPESPRWLLRNQRVEECFKITNYIAQVNRRPAVEKQTLQNVADLERKAQGDAAELAKVKRFTYLDFWRDRNLRKTTVYLQGLWFSWGVVYFGTAYNIKNLAGDRYMNVVYMGLVETIGYLTSFTLSNRLGRRRAIFTVMTFTAVFLIFIAILQLVLDFSNYTTLLAVLLCLGRYGVAAARALLRTLLGESYPTAIRTMGTAVVGSASGIAGAVSSQLVYVGSLWPSVPFFAFAALSVSGSLIGFLLNETAGKALQEEVGSSKKTKTRDMKIFVTSASERNSTEL